ncbi:hypothetical protein SPRG_06987 [Saprolegnia parasitica CBS 223.65]|uniref:Uncharacterized protein n=1 Tax=Saprolegnia parasitica (strain CBS 223.65) TaxID=695850 RepID=A0A067CDY8_SAPPC|nr:hypothetical protein SPRG_06987 [Saprolegnia parasitica CBS 223.65]KDO27400.1 hypothetical protein SPRG_06987 [Saprolegnia parasitica CBS 223.65]|eukprot:XP_012201840.1 hypothetical protein SPRG_06987 [Saprolegnia parasitica CBS 223.65]
MSRLTRLLQRPRPLRAAFSTSAADAARFAFDAPPMSLHPSQKPRVIFGRKAAEQLTVLAPKVMSKVLLVRDRDAGSEKRAQYAQFLLQKANIPVFMFTLQRDCATIDSINQGRDHARRVGANGVVAFGGGNVMDTSRAIAALMANEGNAEDLAQGPLPLPHRAAPLIIMPTVAGCGSEVSNEALVLDEGAEAKLTFTKSPIVAEAVIIDPILTVSVPMGLTAQGALTALGQCIESFLMNVDDAKVDEICLNGIRTAAEALAPPLKDGKLHLNDLAFRERLSLASFYSSLASSATGFGAAHSVGIGVGGLSDTPHLQVCAAFLPLVFQRYESILDENAGDHHFDALAVHNVLSIVTGYKTETLSLWFAQVGLLFNIPDAHQLGFDDTLLTSIVDRATDRLEDCALRSSSLFEKEDIDSILQGALALPTNAKEI